MTSRTQPSRKAERVSSSDEQALSRLLDESRIGERFRGSSGDEAPKP